jgi:hypothetical protein
MVLVAFTESPVFGLRIIREIVVDHNYLRLSVNVKIQCIAAGIIHFLCQKYVFYSVRVFSE